MPFYRHSFHHHLPLTPESLPLYFFDAFLSSKSALLSLFCVDEAENHEGWLLDGQWCMVSYGRLWLQWILNLDLVNLYYRKKSHQKVIHKQKCLVLPFKYLNIEKLQNSSNADHIKTSYGGMFAAPVSKPPDFFHVVLIQQLCQNCSLFCSRGSQQGGR